MLLLALQNSPAASDDSGLDALTLVLVVAFIVSVAALTGLLLRRPRAEADEPLLEPPETAPPVPLPPSLGAPSPVARVQRHAPQPRAQTPAWLDGSRLPSAPADFVAFSGVVLELLAARQADDLGRGLALYSPSFLTRFQQELGVDELGFEQVLAAATFDPNRADLVVRSIEVIESAADRASVRVGYQRKVGEEIYRLVQIEGRWLIDDISPDSTHGRRD